jgi:acyl-CoA synthetase (NDP forming)
MPWGQIPANSGTLALISQSDHLSERMTEHAHFMGFGISKAMSMGKGTILDSTDYMEYLAEDKETKAIGIYVEGVRDSDVSGHRALLTSPNLYFSGRQERRSPPLEMQRLVKTFPE